MKILILTADPKTLLCHRAEMLRAMAARGCKIITAAAGNHAAAEDFVQSLGGKHHPLPLARASLNPFKDLKTLAAIWTLIKAEKPDAVFSYTIKSVCYGSLAAAFAGVKQIHALICGLGYSFGPAASLKQRIVRRISSFLYGLALPRCTQVFFQNADDQALMRNAGILPSRVSSTVVPGSGVDPVAFPFVPPNLGEVRSGVMKFVMITRLLRSKGVADYAAAARIMRQKHPKWEFHLVGSMDPSPDGILSTELESWQQEGIIFYHGETSNVRHFLQNSHAVVLPSYYREGVPRILLEALATGRPILTTNAVGCRETVSLTTKGEIDRRGGDGLLEGENGFLVAPKNIAALTESMNRLGKAPALLESMSLKSRRLAEEKFHVEIVVNAILNALNLHGDMPPHATVAPSPTTPFVAQPA